MCMHMHTVILNNHVAPYLFDSTHMYSFISNFIVILDCIIWYFNKTSRFKMKKINLEGANLPPLYPPLRVLWQSWNLLCSLLKPHSFGWIKNNVEKDLPTGLFLHPKVALFYRFCIFSIFYGVITFLTIKW